MSLVFILSLRRKKIKYKNKHEKNNTYLKKFFEHSDNTFNYYVSHKNDRKFVVCKLTLKKI